jgi:hypothetical protein
MIRKGVKATVKKRTTMAISTKFGKRWAYVRGGDGGYLELCERAAAPAPISGPEDAER